MSGINLHMTEDSYAGAWRPRTLDGVSQGIRPTYYAYAAMAQLIGSGNGTTQIARLSSDSMPAVYDDYVRYVLGSEAFPLRRGFQLGFANSSLTHSRIYAGYGEGRLTSVIIINSLQANASEANKGSLNVSLSLDGYEGQTLYLSYLTAPGADSKNGTVWNGLQYSDTDGTSSSTGAAVRNVTIGEDGTALVNVRDSQALIAYIGSRLGSNQVLLNATIPNDDVDGNTTSTSSGTQSNSTDSSKSVAVVSVGSSHMIAVLILAFWSLVACQIW